MGAKTGFLQETVTEFSKIPGRRAGWQDDCAGLRVLIKWRQTGDVGARLSTSAGGDGGRAFGRVV